MCSVDPDELTVMTRATGGLDISGLCFLSYFVHKFRSTIGKSKQIQPGDRVLVATSGGPSSAALLHLIREGLNENSHKKLRFEPVFLYVDESCVSNSPKTGPEYVEKICSEVISRDFLCYVTSLQQVMAPEAHPPVLFTKEWKEMNLPGSPDLDKKLCELLTSCRSISAQQDLHEQLRHKVILQSAHDLGYTKVFFADNSTKLSINILSQVAVGRGSQLPSRVHFRALHRDVEVYRPMREILEYEIQQYILLHGLTILPAPSFNPEGTSIVSCTEEFILGLQKDFPATIPTVFRTGDKLMSTSSGSSKCSTPDVNGDSGSKSTANVNNDPCVMCGSQIDTGQCEASAFIATLVSQKLSCNHPSVHTLQQNSTNRISDGKSKMILNGEVNDSNELKNTVSKTEDSCDCSQNSDCCDGAKSTANSGLKLLTKDMIEDLLCYGCRIILKEMTEVQHLPVKMKQTAAELERRRHMRAHIQDFLL
ncbi:Cytoplasmic tRNA 2-thiolation protein 2-A-like [Homarus americanus]|uniref:Cytoplasmic tRNA 2-thiolation protein 2 n=1 Tax=Homarus americanus TaxID=6706 RepID=A0A8J5MYL2_HOMAM|nr:Cytoplasmic tRNA 2-thiolation protein 2-A-like [Homarus americanus]